MARKSILLIVVLGIVIVAGAFTVAAQSDTSSTICPGGMMQMQMGRGGMMQNGKGMGMMNMTADDTMMTAAAKALGLDATALIDKLHSGQTLSQIAEAQNVKIQDVYDAMLAQAKTHMDEQVKAGSMTQAQADEHLKWMTDNIATMPMGTGAGMAAGNCMGANGQHGMGMGMGMMGRGHGHGMMGMGGMNMNRGQGMMGNS